MPYWIVQTTEPSEGLRHKLHPNLVAYNGDIVGNEHKFDPDVKPEVRDGRKIWHGWLSHLSIDTIEQFLELPGQLKRIDKLPAEKPEAPKKKTKTSPVNNADEDVGKDS